MKACQDVANVFYAPDSSRDVIEREGGELLLAVLNRSGSQSLDELRGKVFMEKVEGKRVIKPESLPLQM